MAGRAIIIWGAGRVGRGFVADLFAPIGYQPVFVDQDESLIQRLRQAGQYTVVAVQSPENRQDHRITDYQALTTAETESVARAITDTDLVAVAVFPRDFPAVAQQLASGLSRRHANRPDSTLNIILCTNLAHAGPAFQEPLLAALTPETQAWAETHVGVIESLVIRMIAAPPAEELARDPLIVWTNGYAVFPVDRHAFRGEIPAVASLRLVDDMRAEELRKLYTYNTFHAALAYFGALRGCESIMDCFADPQVRTAATGALAESGQALQAECGFPAEDMAAWLDAVQTQTQNPALRDTVARYGGDPRRKLRRADRLVGPLLLARKHDIATPHLTRATAAALLYNNLDDAGAQGVRQQIATMGLQEAIRHLCSLDDSEADIAAAVVAATMRLEHEADGFTRAKRAGALAFEYERIYHGCGQCSLAALLDSLGSVDPDTADAAFAAATSLAGGLGMAGDATCGALVGATMAFGLLYPRRRENFGGDRDNKYRTYALAQQLRERFIEAYGSITCHDIHRQILGRPFDLRNSAERTAFEAAGAHDDKCTGIVAHAVEWAMEIVNNAQYEDNELQSCPPRNGLP